jgi:dTDP-4-dehydrorhamnose 3,5-epimerase
VQVRVESVHLGEIKVLVPEVFEDERGFFLEAYRRDQFRQFDIPDFVQDNHSGSVKNVVRGLHFQWDPPMGKLMRVTVGTAWLVAVDIRKGSPTLGKWFGIECSAKDRRMIYAPPNFARGFCVLSDFAEIQYKCTSIYNAKGESGIRWDDPAIGVEWPVRDPILSGKDKTAMRLADWLKTPQSDHFRFAG